METLPNPVRQTTAFIRTLLMILIAFAGLTTSLKASPQDWMYYFEDESVMSY